MYSLVASFKGLGFSGWVSINQPMYPSSKVIRTIHLGVVFKKKKYSCIGLHVHDIELWKLQLISMKKTFCFVSICAFPYG